MGMGSELLSEMEAEYWAEEYNRESQAKSIIESYKMGICFWTTKDKAKINVSKMTDSHLLNTLYLINKKIDTASELDSITFYAWTTVLDAEKKKREI